MLKGYRKQLTRQIGEHLVTAKLGRMGYIAAPFAGNVPLFDIIATNKTGHSVPIQIKAISGKTSWQLNITSFLRIEFDRGIQRKRGKVRSPHPDLIYVLVMLSEKSEELSTDKDAYFILRFTDLRRHFDKGGYSRIGRKSSSLHCAVWPRHVERFRDNWKLIEKVLPK